MKFLSRITKVGECTKMVMKSLLFKKKVMDMAYTWTMDLQDGDQVHLKVTNNKYVSTIKRVTFTGFLLMG